MVLSKHHWLWVHRTIRFFSECLIGLRKQWCFEKPCQMARTFQYCIIILLKQKMFIWCVVRSALEPLKNILSLKRSAVVSSCIKSVFRKLFEISNKWTRSLLIKPCSIRIGGDMRWRMKVTVDFKFRGLNSYRGVTAPLTALRRDFQPVISLDPWTLNSKPRTVEYHTADWADPP